MSDAPELGQTLEYFDTVSGRWVVLGHVQALDEYQDRALVAVTPLGLKMMKGGLRHNEVTVYPAVSVEGCNSMPVSYDIVNDVHLRTVPLRWGVGGHEAVTALLRRDLDCEAPCSACGGCHCEAVQ